MKWMAVWLGLATTIAVGAEVGDFPAFEVKPPARPAFDVWVEGENWARAAGKWEVRAEKSCYGEKQAVLVSPEGSEHVVEYAVKIPRAGLYLAAVAGQPVGRGYTSPVWWSVDGGEWRHVTSAPTSGAAWGLAGAVNWTNLAVVELTAGEHRLAIRVNEKRGDGHFAYMVDAVALVGNPYIALNLPPKVTTDRPGNVFIETTPTVLRLKYPVKAASLLWRVTDWRGREVLQGTWSTKEFELRLGDLGLGHFRFNFRTSPDQPWSRDLPFARVVDPKTRVLNPDSPFAADSGQSWHAVTPGNPFVLADPVRVISDLAQLAGLTMVRDRMNWGEGSPGQYTWETNERSANLLSERGVRVCGMFHYCPAWTQAGASSYGLPHDLLAMYRFGQAAGKHYAGKVTAWEFWNEEDATLIPAWYYAAGLKAAYLGFHAGNPGVKVLNGASCLHPVPRFMEILMANGAGDYFDVYNCHLYSLHDTPETVRDEQAFLARHGVGDKPIWITENGYLQSGGAEPLAPGAGAEHTEAQELAQAEYLVKAHIRFQSLGIAKNFSFFFCPYNECGAGRVWGILRWDYAAKVAYAAIANLTAQLSNAEFLGTRHQPGIQAFVYRQKDGTRSLVFWSEGKEPKPFSIKDSAKELTAVDFTGGRSVVRPVNGEFAFSADRYPTYVNGFLELPPGEKKDTLPHGREKREDTLPHGRVSLRKGMDLAVVLRMNLGEGFRIVLNKALVDGTDRGRGVLDVFNLSDEVKTGRVENPGTGYTVLGLPESITLKPMSKVSLEVNFKFESAGYGLTQVRLGGTFNGKEISPIYIPVKRPHAGMDPGLQSRPLPVEDAGRWVKNSSGSMTIFADEKEQAAGFKVTFPPATDQWIYPEFRLNLPAESMRGAVGIGFEVKASKAEGWALVMACMDDVHERGEGCWLPYYPTTEWQTVNILFEEDAPVNFRPENIKMLRIGANPSEREFEFRVRKMRVYFKK